MFDWSNTRVSFVLNKGYLSSTSGTFLLHLLQPFLWSSAAAGTRCSCSPQIFQSALQPSCWAQKWCFGVDKFLQELLCCGSGPPPIPPPPHRQPPTLGGEGAAGIFTVPPNIRRFYSLLKALNPCLTAFRLSRNLNRGKGKQVFTQKQTDAASWTPSVPHGYSRTSEDAGPRNVAQARGRNFQGKHYSIFIYTFIYFLLVIIWNRELTEWLLEEYFVSEAHLTTRASASIFSPNKQTTTKIC